MQHDSHTNTTSGTRNATHHTLSFALAVSPLALPALGAGGMPVPCGFADELGAAVVLSVERAEVLATFALEAAEEVGLADVVALRGVKAEAREK